MSLSESIGLRSKRFRGEREQRIERPKNRSFGVLPALSRLASRSNPLGYLFFYEALMYMSLAVYLSQICYLFCFVFF